MHIISLLTTAQAIQIEKVAAICAVALAIFVAGIVGGGKG